MRALAAPACARGSRLERLCAPALRSAARRRAAQGLAPPCRSCMTDDAQVQEMACGALRNLAVNDADQVTLMAAEAHVRIIRAMDRHQDDAQVLLEACLALMNLALNDANKVTLVAAEAHVCIIREMDRHQGDAQVQETACGALWNLAVNDADQVTLMAAEAHVRIIRAMDRHQDDLQVQAWPVARSCNSRSTTPAKRPWPRPQPHRSCLRCGFTLPRPS
jgi:hypothetical protein